MTKTITTTLGRCSVEHAQDCSGHMILRGSGLDAKQAGVFVTLPMLELFMRQSCGQTLRVQGLDASNCPLDKAAQLHRPVASPEHVPFSSTVTVRSVDIAAFLLRTRAAALEKMSKKLASATPKSASPRRFNDLDRAVRELSGLAVFAAP